MNFGPRSASRSFKMATLGLSLSLFSTAAIVAMAQQPPNEFHGVLSGATVSEPGTGSTVRFAEVSAVNDARVATSSIVSSTSEKLSGTASAHHRVPMVTDWSTKHVVFAKPRTEAAATRLEHNTRYKMQTYRRNAPMLRKLADSKVDSSDLLERFRNRVHDPHSLPAKADPARRDWSVNLNGNGVTAPTPTVGNNQFPAKFSFDINATPDCNNDFVVYNTNTSLLVAFNQLYSGAAIGGNPAACGTGAPNVMWAYKVNSYTDGVTSTSVTLSYDGGQVAFVESSPTQGSVLHILKWSTIDGGTIASPVTASDVTGAPSDWATCGGANHGCIYNVFFSNDNIAGGGTAFAPDSNSAPYYDYETDSLYVGTDKANIHKFTNVFRVFGPVPAEAGAPWPIFMNTTDNPPLTGPIEDAFSGRIFVSDTNGDLMYIETGAVIPGITLGPCRGETLMASAYPCLADGDYNSGAGVGIPDPPVVDSSLGTVMVFAGGGGTGANAFVAQSPTSGDSMGCVCGAGEAPGGPFVFANFGPVSGGGTGTALHSGDFDNGYYNSDGPGSTTVAGYMYVCAIDPLGATTGGGNTALRQLGFNADGVITTVDPAFVEVANDSYDECSPVTEVYNPAAGQDLMFFSVQAHSQACAIDGLGVGGWPAAAPAGGCLMSFDATEDATLDFAALIALHSSTGGIAAFLPEDGGTSGIIVDNVASVAADPQASSIYFTPLGYTASPGNCTFIGCAVKATQNGLQ